jgi:hypothetical protein
MPTALAVLNPLVAVFCFCSGFVGFFGGDQALAQNIISFEVVELDGWTRHSRCFNSERQLRYQLPVYSALNQSALVKSYHSGPGRTREVWLLIIAIELLIIAIELLIIAIELLIIAIELLIGPPTETTIHS